MFIKPLHEEKGLKLLQKLRKMEFGCLLEQRTERERERERVCVVENIVEDYTKAEIPGKSKRLNDAERESSPLLRVFPGSSAHPLIKVGRSRDVRIVISSGLRQKPPNIDSLSRVDVYFGKSNLNNI
jgi:hypothetical protein